MEKLAFIPPQLNGVGTKRPNTNEESLLLDRTANQCLVDASNKPIPKMLFSEFWHEGELSILFSDTNLGKSILAVQIGDSISKGRPIRAFQLTAEAQPVLYFDFEMSEKQFEQRCSNNYEDHYVFDDRFIRLEINPKCVDFADFEKQLFQDLTKQIEKHSAKVLIIDNLTYLRAQAIDTAKEALPLMKKLKELKLEHGLSLLVLAHTPKRNPSNPITVNDLSGSRHLANFADSIFAIGASGQGKGIRYIKQIKSRATELVYDAQNVIICEIHQPFNFLSINLLDFGQEGDHLAPGSSEKEDLEIKILDLRAASPDMPITEMARILGTYREKIHRVLRKHSQN